MINDDNRFNNVVRKIKNRTTSITNQAIDFLGLFWGEVTPAGIVTPRFKKMAIKDYIILDFFINVETTKNGSPAHTHSLKTELKNGDIVLMAVVEGEFVVIGRAQEE